MNTNPLTSEYKYINNVIKTKIEWKVKPGGRNIKKSCLSDISYIRVMQLEIGCNLKTYFDASSFWWTSGLL